jgi:hypothetical protein
MFDLLKVWFKESLHEHHDASSRYQLTVTYIEVSFFATAKPIA